MKLSILRRFEPKISEIFNLSGNFNLTKKLTYLLIAATLFSTLATYSAITGSEPFGPDPHKVIMLVLVDLVCFLALMTLISRKIFLIWYKGKNNLGSNRLQSRILIIFALVSSIPTITVAVFSTLFFNFGIQSWFNERITTALDGSITVAEAYLNEHRDLIRTDILSMSGELSNSALKTYGNKEYFEKLVAEEAEKRKLTEAVVFDQNGIFASTKINYYFAYDMIPKEAFEQADSGKIVIIHNKTKDIVRGLIKLINYPNTYLMVGRYVDDNVLRHIDNVDGAATEYKRLKNQINKLQIQFSIIFFVVSLTLLLSAIWLGMNFASKLVSPIGKLIKATDRIKEGDFSVRIEESKKNDEINILAKAFNHMTMQIEEQRNELVEASNQIDARRLFIETVLSGVSAGVIALDKDQNVTILNPQAQQILNKKINKSIGKSIAELVPEFAELFEGEYKEDDDYLQREITICKDGLKKILMVRIAAERKNKKTIGYVITFDDLTDFLIAQRSAAWSDIARRIAHEIKNPLTPIMLAAERIKSKFSGEVSEKEIFEKYVETIKKHVGDIGKMVEEFVNFAKIQAPLFEKADIVKTVKDAIFLEQIVGSKTKIITELPEKELLINCDARQISQILINLLKNSRESIEQIMLENKTYFGEIKVALATNKKYCTITISDNGKGFGENVERLVEPYVTTKPKGTGLGLAIVKKIIDDHNGILKLENNALGGAIVSISIPL